VGGISFFMEALIMQRFLGTTVLALLVLVSLGSMSARAYDSPQKYGVEFRGGLGIYDMGDVTNGINTLKKNLGAYHPTVNGNSNSLLGTNGDGINDNGPTGGFSFLYRPSRHTQWEVGFNALLDVENTVDTQPDTASGQILMHANEFFLKGHVVATLSEHLNLNFGAGAAYYVSELQIQDNKQRNYYYNVDGPGWGLLGSVGLEFLATNRVGIALTGGGRFATTSHFTYETTPGTRTGFNVLYGSRPMEVNLSGVYAQLGVRLYFDKVTQPVDFTR
jgi:hypothetical protein